jgi:hypothetical protein
MGLNLSFKVSIIRTSAQITQVYTPSATNFAVTSCQTVFVSLLAKHRH